MSNNSIDSYRATGTSVGTGTFVATYSLEANSGATAPLGAGMHIVIVGRDTGNGNSVYVRKECLEKIDGSSNASIVGSIVDVVGPVKDLALLLTSVSVTTSGADTIITCTGVTGRTIEWMVTLTAYIN